MLVEIIFIIFMTHCFLVNSEIVLRLIFHIKIKWAATCSNGFSLLWMGWRARRAAGEGNALWCQWFVYLILLQLILLYFSISIYSFILILKAIYIIEYIQRIYCLYSNIEIALFWYWMHLCLNKNKILSNVKYSTHHINILKVLWLSYSIKVLLFETHYTNAWYLCFVDIWLIYLMSAIAGNLAWLKF